MIIVNRSAIRTVLLLLSLVFLAPESSWAAPLMSLAGYWQFQLDPTDSGERLQWFNRNFPSYSVIKLPGTLQSQNYGDEISTKTPWVMTLYDRFWYLREDYKAYTERGNIKVPFLSQPPRHYVGVAWFQKQILVPQYWVTRRVVLTLERPHWATSVWLDGQKIGSDRSLVAPHVYDLGTLSPGRHRLTIRIDNRLVLPYRPDAHSVSDSLAGNWNGIVGRIELTDTGRVWIDDVQAFPNLALKSMLIKVRIGNITGRSGAGTLTAIWPDVGIVPVSWDEKGGTAEVEVPIRLEAETWDEFHPKLQPLRLWLKGTGVDEYAEIKVGLRDFHAEGKEFILNGRPITFRGTINGGDFPLTGYPATDVAAWRMLFSTYRAWGLNHIRFHSWCPPEAAFEAADQLGFYLQVEPGMWNEISPGTPMERMLYEETDRMIRSYGNHPSFMLLSGSNEPKGKWKESLPKWVEHYRKEDPRRLYTSGTGHTERQVPNLTEGTDYLAIQRIGPNMLRRESGWFGNDYAKSLVDVNLPVISHEVGQWAAYPDYDLIKKFTGFMQPGNLEIFRDSMKGHGLLERNRDFARASGRFQLACYKEDIEANLRTPGLSGFQLLDLHDYLGQGTSFVGLLDAFWQPKSYANSEEFKEFSNTTVPLARLKRVWTTAETFDVDVEVAHYGAEPIENALAVWRIEGPQPPIQGEWETRTIPIGKNIRLGKITVDLSRLPAPAEYNLVVTVAPVSFFSSVDRKILIGQDVVKGVTYFENHWNFWLYPEGQGSSVRGMRKEQDFSPTRTHHFNPVRGETAQNWRSLVFGLQDCPSSPGADILVTSSWDDAEKRLAKGGRVLFAPHNSELDWTSPPLDMVPVSWNRLMNPAWGHMMGLLIDRKIEESKGHALDLFPTASNFDWQWAEIIHNVRAINLDRLPPELEPVVWAIDDWNRNYKLGVIFECAVGDGKLLVSAFDVTKPANTNPVLRQLRRSLLTYVGSDCFQPNVPVLPQQIHGLLFDNLIMKKRGAVAQIGGASALAVIDGDPNTFVLVGNQQEQTREQVDIVITFPLPTPMAGLVLMPRQNHREHEGDIREYVVQVSDDGADWRDVGRGELVSTFSPQQIEFSKVVTARYLKFISLSGFGPDKTTALAELAIMYAARKTSGSAVLPGLKKNALIQPDLLHYLNLRIYTQAHEW